MISSSISDELSWLSVGDYSSIISSFSILGYFGSVLGSGY